MMKIDRLTLQDAARSLTSVHDGNIGYEVSTPVVYPNGDCVGVIVSEAGSTYTVHDAGLAAMLFSAEGGVLSREIAARFRGCAARYDCEFEGGRVLRISDANDLVTAIMLVANASRAVADQIFEGRKQVESNFRTIVAERLRQIIGARLRENETFKGQSGRSYRVTGVILDASETRPVAFVSPLASRASVSTQFRDFFDLHAAWPGVLKETVYDEASDFRPDEDGWVLKQVGDLVPYSAMATRMDIIGRI